MAILTPSTILAAWSFRKELIYVATAFLIVLAMPIVAVIILTNTGINIVSDKLATVNVQTQSIQIRNPADNSVVKEIHAQIVWPVKGVITLGFGESDLPYQLLHTGIDIANPSGKIGDPIVPFMNGKVIYAGETAIGYGKHIIIDHGDNITSVYGHLDKVYVFTGQQVTTNDVIGLEGQTGWATGPHLHFEVRVFGIPVNPRIFLLN